jgi:DNA polymerase-3 subunit delta
MALVTVNPEDLLASLKAGESRPVYLLAGPDSHRMEKTARWLRERSVDAEGRDFNCETLYGDECKPGQIVEKARAYPMFGSTRFVWVRRAEALPTGRDIEPLLAYLQAPVESTVLLFSSNKLDKRLKLTALCAETGWVVEFAALSGAALVRQLQRQSKSHGLRLMAEGAQLLVELVGEDLGELDNELAKLALQDAAEGRPLHGDEIRELVARSRDVDAFRLADSLDRRAPLAALLDWFQLRRGGGDVFGVAAILGWKLRQIALLRAGLDDGLPPESAAKMVGLAPWQMRRTMPLAQATTGLRAGAALSAWRTADRRAKSSSLGAGLAYDLAVLEWALAEDTHAPRGT